MTTPDMHAPWALARVGRRALDRYRIDAVVASGAGAVVFRGVDLVGDTRVAIKVMHPGLRRDPTTVARFQREIRLAAVLRHPALVRLCEGGVDEDGAPVLVTEYLDGEDLQRRLDRDGAVGLGDVLSAGAWIADALDAVHRGGVVHRDVKPANVMVLREGAWPASLRLLDFGAALCADEARLSAASDESGTPWYRPPEQVGLAPTPVSPASDVYALGKTLLHMLAGRRAPRAASAPEPVRACIDAMTDAAAHRRPGPARLVAHTLRSLAVARDGDRFDPQAGLVVSARADPAELEAVRRLVERLREATQARARIDARLRSGADAPHDALARLRARWQLEDDAVLDEVCARHRRLVDVDEALA